MDHTAIARIMARQEGVIARRQVLACGGDDNDIERMVRRRLWARVHTGVYVRHTGPLPWVQRAWTAVLYHWPAALAAESALAALEAGVTERGTTPRDHRTIVLVVPATRRVVDPPGMRTRSVRDFDAIALMHLSPPRVRVEHAVLDVASGQSTAAAAVAVLGDACQQGRTTPQRLLVALEARPRLPRRRLISSLLGDVVSGARSALERGYLVGVERTHGLPTGKRQRRVRSGRSVAYRDVEYVGLRTVVELDGRLGHERSEDRWADMDRDVDSLLVGDVTIRLGWGHVLDPCRTAAAVARLLVARGWTGTPRPCGPECPVGRVVRRSA
ncbi:MAG TPA: hypothetical protein VFJ94_15695 [Intrasporangium sp.]|uniref:hypothetical protein n=1 Tax=Intrasporangium sp. TaxID=1925024 RepID=UPI002D793EC5|nr:hypothetical protein [Intrasporangium sp.]HET7399958.1 hypothetical protein [Intrasporangium sp.]